MFWTPLIYEHGAVTQANALNQNVQASLLRLAHLFFDFVLQQQTITHFPGRFLVTFFNEGQRLATRFGQTVVGTESNTKFDIVGAQAHLVRSAS